MKDGRVPLLFILVLGIVLILIVRVVHYDRLKSSYEGMGREYDTLMRDYQALKISRQDNIKTRVEGRIQELRPRLDPALRLNIADAIIRHSKEHGLSNSLVLHLIYVESRFNPLATSKAGAAGLMQIMPKVWKIKLEENGVKQPFELYYIDPNIRVGCEILALCLKDRTLVEGLEKYVGGKQEKYIRDIFRLMAEWER